jgi:hypothetical protein
MNRIRYRPPIPTHLRHQGRYASPTGYYDNHVVDNDSCVIVGVQATAARLDLHRDTQMVWPVPAAPTVHPCGIPLLGHSSARTGAATRTGASQYA